MSSLNTCIADTAAHLPSESVGRNSRQILKSLKFAGGKTFTNDFHVLLLKCERTFEQKTGII